MTFNFSFNPDTGHLNIEQGSTLIPDDAFNGKNEVKSVKITDSLVTIGERAFRENSIDECTLEHFF